MISIGVDIGTYSIKLAEVESTSKSYVIRGIREIPLTLDLTKDRKIEVIDALRSLFSNYDLDKTQFVFSVPQKSVSLRLITFPFRERFKVQRAVAVQLEDDLPFSQDDAVFDTKIVRFKGKSAEVLAMAAPKERVGEILNLAHDCGVEPVLISNDSMGLINLFVRWDQAPGEYGEPVVQPGEGEGEGGGVGGGGGAQPLPRKGADLFLNIGHLNSQLIVFSEGVSIAVRNIDWGAKNLADAINAKYGLNYIQGVTELQAKGFLLVEKGQGTKEQVIFSQTLEKSLQDLVKNMRLKMLEMESEYNLQWQKALLAGGGSGLRNLAPYLTQMFEIPFNRYKQFENHPAVNFEFNAHLESTCSVAVGLALEGLKRPRNPATNFLQGEFARQTNFFEALWERWGYTVQMGIAAFFIMLVYGVIRESFSQRLLDESDRVLKIQAEAIAGLKAKSASNKKIEKFIADVDKDSKNRKSAERVTHLNSALDVLNLISAGLPPGKVLPLEIKRILIDNETAEVHGYTTNSSDVARVQQVLQKVSANGKTENIPPQIKTPAGRTPFAFRIHVQRFSGG